jgi:hypothetical protein
MASRFKRAIGEGSMFKAAASQMAAAPLAQGFQMALEHLIPKDFGKQHGVRHFIGGWPNFSRKR